MSSTPRNRSRPARHEIRVKTFCENGAAAALGEGENQLTEREREVLSASADGATIQEVARMLYLSEGTVRNYLSTAIKKLDARNRFEAARLAEWKAGCSKCCEACYIQNP